MTGARASTARRARNALSRWVGYLIIAAALVLAVARLTVPWYLNNVQRSAQFLSAQLGQPVTLKSVQVNWTGSRPRLGIAGLTIGERNPLRIANATVEIDPYAWLPGHQLIHSVSLRGLELQADRDRDGPWQLLGRSGGADSGSQTAQILRYFKTIHLVDVRFTVNDAQSDFALRLIGLDISLARQGESIRVAGRLSGDSGSLRAVAVLDSQSRLQQAYLHAQAFTVGGTGQTLRWAGSSVLDGTVDGEIWLSQRESSRFLTGRLDLNQLLLRGPSLVVDPSAASSVVPEHRLSVQISGQMRADSNRSALTATINFPTPSAMGLGPQRLTWQRVGDSEHLALSALALEHVMPIAHVLGALPASARGLLYRSSPSGVLRELRYDGGDSDWQVSADFESVAIAGPNGKLQGVSGLSGMLRGDAQAFIVDLASENAALAVSKRFASEVPVRELRATIVVTPLHDGRYVEVSNVVARGPGFNAVGDLSLQFRQDKPPRIDLLATVSDNTVAAANYFWLTDAMSPKLVEWLRSGLRDGEVPSGRWVWRGPLGKGQVPYRDPRGRLEAEADIVGVTLAFHPDWPVGKDLQATVRFEDAGMSIERGSAMLAANPITALGAQLPDFKAPILTINAKGESMGAPLLGLLRDSPLRKRHGEQLAGMEASGPATVTTEIVVPLRADLGKTTFAGTVALRGLSYHDDARHVHFSDLFGDAVFDDDGFAAPAVRGVAHGAPVDVAIALGSTHTGESATLTARATGVFAATELAQDFPSISRWLGPATGRAPFDISVRVMPVEADLPVRTTVTIRSDLAGVAVNLPAPLGKPGALPTPFMAEIGFVGDRAPQVTVEWGQRLRLQGQAPVDAPFQGAMRIGRGAMPEARADNPGLVVAATISAEQPESWLPLLLAGGGDGSGGLAALTLETEGSGPFGALQLDVQREAGSVRIRVDGDRAQGSLQWNPATDGRAETVYGQFERLHLPRNAEQKRTGAAFAADPRGLPTLHLKVDDLRLGEIALGTTRLETFPTPDGLHVDLFESRSPALNVDASGDWRVHDGEQNSSFALRFTAEDLGKMLASLGFSEPVVGGQTLAEVNGSWDGNPLDFGLEALRGKMTVSIGEGRFVGIEPGAGRVLGLISLRELPRRLALDFSDFFDKGLGFGSIKGSFELKEGNAWTQDLKLKGPSSDIEIIGRTGFAARDYDQEVTVTPQFSTVLPVVGALAAGPAGAAAGLLMQGVVNQDKSVGQVRYSITGSWDKPRVDRKGGLGPVEAIEPSQ